MERWKLILGVWILAATVCMAATYPPYIERETSRTVEVTVDSSATDSTWLYDTVEFKTAGYDYMGYRLIVTEPADSLPGQGLDDSIRLILELYRQGLWRPHDSAGGTVATDTLTGEIFSDSILQGQARFIIWLYDTTSDTTGTMSFPVTLEYFMKK